MSLGTDLCILNAPSAHWRRDLYGASCLPDPVLTKTLRREGYETFPLCAVPDDITAATEFRSLVAAAKDSHGPRGACLHLYEASEYAGMRLFRDAEGLAGFALKGSEIVSVFCHRCRARRQVLPNLMALAVHLGGDRLNAFDTVLPELYRRCGFTAVARLTWNDNEAPIDWDYDAVSEFNGGRPDVVFMIAGRLARAVVSVRTFADGLERQQVVLAATRYRAVA